MNKPIVEVGTLGLVDDLSGTIPSKPKLGAKLLEGKQEKVGVVGLFDDPHALVKAAEKVRDAGWKQWDCHTPFPVHGLDAAMGLGWSKLPTIALSLGFTGAALALLMQYWMSAVSYPVHIGGKPLFSWPAFVPITFEMFVLFTAAGTVLTGLWMCKLGRWHSPLHDSGVMAEVSSSRFALVLSAKDELWSDGARSLLDEAGCTDVRDLFEDVDDGRIL